MRSDALPALPIDWDEVEHEATDLLQRYLRIDTTNPPGGEEAGAQLLAEALRKEGFEPRFYDAGGGRVSLSARLPGSGDGGARPLVLLSHIDVVPAEREHWRKDPFGGELEEGVLWGRGALDMKGLGIMELLSLFLLKRHRVRHRRDVLFLAVADEEEGGRHGMGWLAEHHPELLHADGVINEGAYGFGNLLGSRGLVFAVAPAEKAPLWLRLTAQGRPGHASSPHDDNAASRLVRALARVASIESRLTLRPEMEHTVEALRSAGYVPDGFDLRDPAMLERVAAAHPTARALLSNSVSLTTLASGRKHNVIPASATATLDCRLLPGEDTDAFLADLRAAIDDERVALDVVYRSDPIVSEVRSELLDHVEATIANETDGGAVVPMICPAFTDSRFYRQQGVPALGFCPVLLSLDELAGVHGHDERLSTANLRLGTRLLLDTVRRAAGELPA